MSYSLEYTASYPNPVSAVYSALTNERYWADRLAKAGGRQGRLVSAATSGTSFDIAMVQTVPQEKLPNIVTKIRSGDLVINRTESWAPLISNRATATLGAKIEGAPATISGQIQLSGDETSTHITTIGRVDVKIPFIGGKIETVMGEQLARMLAYEDEFNREWFAAHL